MLFGGRSDLKPAINLNDAANKFFTDMIHASEFISLPQRVLTGVELPRDPITGEVIDTAQVKAAVNRIWAFEDPNAHVFDLAMGSLSNYVEGIDLAVQHMAAQTRTPPHYLLAKLANLAADALKAAETGLVARCKRKHLDFSDAYEEAMRLAFKWRAISRQGWAGSDEDLIRSQMTDAEVICEDPESKDPLNETQSLPNKEFPDYAEKSFEPVTVFGDRRGYLRSFEWTPPDGERVAQLQLYRAESGREYTVTATTVATKFLEVKILFEQALRELRLRSHSSATPASFEPSAD